MDSRTYEQIRGDLGEGLFSQLNAQIDESVPTGVVEQRSPGRPTVRMSAQSFVRRTLAEMPRSHSAIQAHRKRERQNRAAGRRQRG